MYKRLDIENLVDRGESFYNDMMKGMVEKLKDLGEKAECSEPTS